MCGFAGIVEFGQRGVDPSLLTSLGDQLYHRGPDEQGLRIEGPCGLAHRRLSIVDLAASHQPMAPEDCDVALAYNGELYNYLDLRKSFTSQGLPFRTNGDTEVLLRWVANHWIAGLPDLDGMFAFAAWDRRLNRLLLARDPIGEKPLFYATPRPDLIVFGSEAKAVLAHPEVSCELDPDSLRQAIRFRTVYGTRTLYRGVQQLPPGTYLEFERSGYRVASYFDLVTETRLAAARIEGMSPADIVRQGSHLLTTAVRERLMADVPLGVFLSGGLDSSLIAAVLRKLHPDGTLRTFSVGFQDDAHSELSFAKEVAGAIGAAHTEVAIGPEEFRTRLAVLAHHRDGPVSEPADVAIAALSRTAKQHVKVVLSGEGADEAFAGYPKYTLTGVPAALRWPLAVVGPDRAASIAALLGLDRRRSLVAARSLVHPREVDRLTQWFSYFDRGDLESLLPGLGWTSGAWQATAAEQAGALARAEGMSPIGRTQIVDCLSWLPGNMLERGDRMTMAEGLELRPPFLDKQLVAFGLALPDRMKVRGKWTKWIVRQWGNDLLPPVIHRRPKWGFRVPLAQWFRRELRDMLHDYLLSEGGLCGTHGDRRAVRRLLEAHDAGTIDANLALWGLFTTEVWYQDVYRRRIKDGVVSLSHSSSIRPSSAVA